ncbi:MULTISPECIES: FecR family protein [Flavobacteriaceae]|uniref:FecR family protein n=1 Tax=Flavobacteriaceae TaxID=49546 RepID=UPI0014914C09|nr:MULTISPECIES: FecR family protein [Allomuricauda]MDC6365861.1 DUF4974 domain-containing protein [Muricauda sp. AC10]
MVSPEIEKCLVNFVNKSANVEELRVLEVWIKDLKNHSVFEEYVKTHFIVTLANSNPDSSAIRFSLLEEIRKEKRKRRILSTNFFLKYAAILLFMVGAGYFINNEFGQNDSDQQLIVPKEEVITLQLEDGTTRVIEENGSVQVKDRRGNILGKQQGSKLVYDTAPATYELVYNTLTVPYGKRFDVVLSDGTHVFLNAGTSLKFPVQFIPGQNREVFLNGEAFFDVVKDTENPFLVNVDELSVQVLGTKFNVANYTEDTFTDVVLVEGSVDLDPGDNGTVENVILKPGAKGSFNKVEKTISTKKVNTSIYTAWVEGDVVFRNARFQNIAKRLERLYNVRIINNNRELDNEVFNASFEVENENINDILRYFNKVYQIEYKIANDTIIIN